MMLQYNSRPLQAHLPHFITHQRSCCRHKDHSSISRSSTHSNPSLLNSRSKHTAAKQYRSSSNSLYRTLSSGSSSMTSRPSGGAAHPV